VRHPCNAYSNVLYVTCGLVALSLAKKEKDKAKENGASYIWIPDTMFGVGLFLLAFVSFMWHASNVAWIHYVDLATMETVIVYLQLRWGAIVAVKCTGITKNSAALGVTALFVALAAFQISLNHTRYVNKAFDGGFPTGRGRMATTSGVHFSEAILLWLLPIVFDIFPMLAMVVVGSVGEVRYATMGRLLLAVGWALHNFERYCYDTFCIPVGGPLAFVTSPTGVFHMLTAGTIMTSLMHISTVEAYLDGGKSNKD